MESLTNLKSHTNHIHLINNSLGSYTEYHIANENEYDDIHHILENEAMELQGFVKLKYTRKPDLFGSYLESGQIPAIITDEDKKFLGVVSEVDVKKFGQSQKAYYTSDLRIAKSAGIRTRAKFRQAYLEVLKNLPGECYTVVLKDNEKAIKALTRSKDLFYHKVYEYTSHSILGLPSLGYMRTSKSLLNFTIEKADSNAYQYIKDKLQFSEFSHGVNYSDHEFVIKSSGRIVGYFSLKKPTSRNLFVEPENSRVGVWLKAIKLLFKHDYKKKIPWTYITNFIVDSDIDKSELYRFVLKYLYQNKYFKSGELILTCHGASEEVDLRLPVPVFSTNGCLFKVSANQSFKEFDGPVYLNPLYL